MLGSSRVIPEYEMIRPLSSSKAFAHFAFSAAPYSSRDISRFAAYRRFQQLVRYSKTVSFWGIPARILSWSGSSLLLAATLCCNHAR